MEVWVNPTMTSQLRLSTQDLGILKKCIGPIVDQYFGSLNHMLTLIHDRQAELSEKVSLVKNQIYELQSLKFHMKRECDDLAEDENHISKMYSKFKKWNHRNEFYHCS
jgi:DNA repair ATPase RecN